MRLVLLFLVLLATPLMARGSSFADDAQRTTSDLVVFGKVESQKFIETLGELGIDSVFTARFRITRVQTGNPPSRPLTIRYIAHTYLSEDREFHFRLRPTSDGTYLVCSEGGRGFACK